MSKTTKKTGTWDTPATETVDQIPIDVNPGDLDTSVQDDVAGAVTMDDGLKGEAMIPLKPPKESLSDISVTLDEEEKTEGEEPATFPTITAEIGDTTAQLLSIMTKMIL